MSKRIGIFSPYAINTPHFETELEIAQNHLNQGDEVIIFFCKKKMPICDVNVKHERKKCDACFGRFKSGSKIVVTCSICATGGTPPIAYPTFSFTYFASAFPNCNPVVSSIFDVLTMFEPEATTKIGKPVFLSLKMRDLAI